MEMTPADYGAQTARQDAREAAKPITPWMALTNSRTQQRDALYRLLHAATKTKALWDEHGLGDDHEVSEAAYYELRDAIKQAATALEMRRG